MWYKLILRCEPSLLSYLMRLRRGLPLTVYVDEFLKGLGPPFTLYVDEFKVWTLLLHYILMSLRRGPPTMKDDLMVLMGGPPPYVV
jgi:hypothetical protein